MCDMTRSKGNAKRRAARPRPLRMRPVPTGLGGESDRSCAVCGAVQTDKFDSTLMCSLGHATCFRCVAAGVQPHTLCGHACNGFKYKCAGCEIWLCINKTQELAMMCGGHSLARERLREERIEMETFECPGAFVPSGEALSYADDDGGEEEGDYASEDDGTRSSSSSDYCGECPCGGARDAFAVQLPRVCDVDWASGQEQRARRLARLRASLLGR